MVMESSESWERYEQGLIRAASCCRELGAMTSLPAWKELSKQLLIMLDKGRVIYNGVALTEAEVLILTANIQTAQLVAYTSSSMQ